MSYPPPAGAGTTMRTVRVGYDCAQAMRDTTGSAAAPAARCKNVRRGSFVLNLPLASVLDHLIGECQQLIRHIEPERFGGCKVDGKIELGRQLDRHVGGLRSFENPAGVVASTAIGIALARPV